MLTPKEEKFCKNLEIEKMSQRAAYRDAYPASQKWTDNAVDVEACKLANDSKILLRRKEIRDEETAIMQKKAQWTRDNAFTELQWLIDKAKEDVEKNEGLTKPSVSALVSAVKELNTIFAVSEKTEGGGVLEDILSAVRGINND
jgi:hypothetical protein